MKYEKPTYHRRNKKDGIIHLDRQNTQWAEIVHKCKHKWQPLSFVFETQLLDKDGRVLIRQPELVNGRVYCVCMKCLSHTYVETGWAGFYLGGPDDLESPS